MDLLILCLEIIGTVSFAISGAMTALKKDMDIFGVSVLGITTAVGGGIIRDLLLGLTPPAALSNPRNVFIALCISIIIFIPAVRRFLLDHHVVYDKLLLYADSLGLGLFTVFGLEVAVKNGYGSNFFLLIFVAVITGVGGGVIRDLFAGDRPYIFVKHIYACAAIFGALVCELLRPVIGLKFAMITGLVVIVIVRLLSAKYRWSLPRSKETV